MDLKNQHIIFEQLVEGDQVPYDLLLLADPSVDIIEEYLKHSEIFIAKQREETLGVIVLFPLTAETVEIKNISVQTRFQGQGFGSYLIKNAIRVAIHKKYKNICIGTANSSIGQLYLYQKLGFEITEIRKDFFTDNYAEIIYENGIQAKHMLLLTRQL